jgi:parallel beta-helix repeat protein
LGKTVSGMMVMLLLIGMLTMAFNAQQVKAQECEIITINSDGSITNNSPAAPISTTDNITYTFTGNIVNCSIAVNRSNIVLDGVGYMLSGFGTGHGIDLYRVFNVTIENTSIANFDMGIYLNSSSNSTVSANTVTANTRNGIVLAYSSYNIVSENNATHNHMWDGIQLYYSSYNTVSENNASYNWGDGIALYNSPYNTVSRNNATHNTSGFELGSSNYCIVSRNSISDNAMGIDLWSSYCNISENNVANNDCGIFFPFDASNNTISGNNFMNNAHQVYDEYWENPQYGTPAIDVWDNGYPSGGNYWSDYSGVDLKKGPNQNEPGSDNIGDTPYIIDAVNLDHYPLMYPYGSTPPPTYSLTITTTANGTTNPTTGTYFYSQGQSVPVQAIPDTGYALVHWELDGVNLTENPINVIMDMAHTLHAVFRALVHDITVTNITPSKTVVGQNYSMKINVTVADEGNYTETFNVTLSANATAIATQTIQAETPQPSLSTGTLLALLRAATP